MHVEARRVDRQRFLQQLARFGAVVGVHRLIGEEHVRVHGERIDLERALDERRRLRRVVVLERARAAEERRRPARIGFERRLIRLDRFGVVVFLEEQVAPRRLDRGVVRRGRRRVPKRGVRLLELAERLQRPSGARELRGGPRRVSECGDARKGTVRPGTAEQLLQQAELERGFARRRTRRRRLQRRFSVRVQPARDGGTRLQRDDVRILRVELVRQGVDLGVAALDERARRGLERRRRNRRRCRRPAVAPAR